MEGEGEELRVDGEVLAIEMRRCVERQQQIFDGDEVSHLLLGDVADGVAPVVPRIGCGRLGSVRD